ncbi:MAG: PAS domain-containing protein, partial [Flavobacteriaceae bacterium]|nr:PAS domain-containing protein [Flavobacteriaceae bacterium]
MSWLIIAIVIGVISVLVSQRRRLFLLAMRLISYRRWYIYIISDSLSFTLHQYVNYHDMFKCFISKITLVFPFEYVSLYYTKDGYENLQALSHYGDPVNVLDLPSKSLWQWFDVHRQSITESNGFRAAKTEQINEIKQFRAHICIPLFSMGKLQGILLCGGLPKHRELQPFDCNQLWKISQILSLAIQHALLHLQNQTTVQRLSQLHLFSIESSQCVNQKTLATLSTQLLRDLFGLKTVLYFHYISDVKLFIPMGINHSNCLSLYQYPLSIDETILSDLSTGSGSNMHPIFNQNQTVYRLFSAIFRTQNYFIMPIRNTHGNVHGLFLAPIYSSNTLITQDSLIPIAMDAVKLPINRIANFEAMRKTNAYNQAVLDNNPVGIIVLDKHLNIVSCNSKALKLFNETHTLIEKKVSQVYDKCPDIQQIEHVAISQVPIAFETTICYDSTVNSIYLSAQIIQSEILCMITDLSAMRKLQLKIKQSNQLSMLGAMSASIAHEIKNSLVGIHSFAQLLPSNWENESFRDKFSSLVINQLTRVTEMTRLLGQLGKPSITKLQPVNLNHHVKQAIELLTGEFNKNRVAVINAIDNDIIIKADVNQLFQLFTNVLL